MTKFSVPLKQTALFLMGIMAFASAGAETLPSVYADSEKAPKKLVAYQCDNGQTMSLGQFYTSVEQSRASLVLDGSDGLGYGFSLQLIAIKPQLKYRMDGFGRAEGQEGHLVIQENSNVRMILNEKQMLRCQRK